MNKVRLSTRELLDLRPWLGLNLPSQDVNAASRVVLHYIEAFESGDQINTLALLYILQALRRAVASTDGDLGKELGIKRPKPGNPGGLSRKRRLTPTEMEEIAIEFEQRVKQAVRHRRVRGEGSNRDRILRDLKAEHGVSVRTVENCVAVAKKGREAAEELIERHSKFE